MDEALDVGNTVPVGPVYKVELFWGYGTDGVPVEPKVLLDALETPLPKPVGEVVSLGPTEYVELHGVGKGGIIAPSDEELLLETVDGGEMAEVGGIFVPGGSKLDVEL